MPAGLSKLTAAQQALAELYGLSKALIAAAARDSPPLSKRGDVFSQYEAWLQHQPDATKTTWLARLMADPRSEVRQEMVAEFKRTEGSSCWPTVSVDRTIAELKTVAEGIHQKHKHAAAERAARQRAKKLADMAADPTKTLRETESLVKHRNSQAYAEIATLLADLRQALSGTAQADLAEQQARKLKQQNPTLHLLTSELRRKGFVKK